MFAEESEQQKSGRMVTHTQTVGSENSSLLAQHVDTLTPEEKKAGINKGWLFFYSFTMALGMFQFGYLNTDMALSAFPWMYGNGYLTQNQCPEGKDGCPNLIPYKDTSFVHQQFMNFSNCFYYLGATIAVLTAKSLMSVSKWKLIMIANGIIILGSLMQLENVFWNIVAGRFVAGIGAGYMTAFVPLSVSTMSPPELSGPLGMLNQISCCLGIVLGCVICLPMNSVIREYDDPTAFEFKSYWRIVYSMPIFIGILQNLAIYCFFRVDLPQDLKAKGDIQGLTQLFDNIYDRRQHAYRIQLIKVEKAENPEDELTYGKALCDRKYSKSTWIAIFLCFAQPATGINVIIQYSAVIFGALSMKPSTSSVIIQSTNMIASISSFPAPAYFGRKTLFIITFAGQTVALVLAGIAQMTDQDILGLIMVCVYCVFFQFGPGPVMWLYNAEICKGASLTAATGVNWGMNVFFALVFPFLQEAIHMSGCFFLFAIISGISFFFSIFVVKETKGLTAIQLENLYRPEDLKIKSEVRQLEEDDKI